MRPDEDAQPYEEEEEEEEESDVGFEEVECKERIIDGVVYLVDPDNGKVYSTNEGNRYLGKLKGEVVDFNAADSSDENASEDEGEDQPCIDMESVTKKQRVYM